MNEKNCQAPCAFNLKNFTADRFRPLLRVRCAILVKKEVKTMKIKYILSLLLALLLLSPLTGCRQLEEAPSTTLTVDEQAYLDRIAQLEATLQKEREERYITESEQNARITALQARLEALEGDTETNVTPAPEQGELVFAYRVEGGKAIITAFEGSGTLVTVPAELDGYPVVGIGERAFEGKPVAAVILPEGLEAVGWFAFYGCESLLNVTLPTSVTSIGYAVFDGCPHVTLVCREGSYAAQYADSYGLPRVSN